jgi:hypothetical protein
MTDAEPQLNVLALNSGSSSLKFGLYCVGSSRIERLVSGEVESIGDKSGKFHAEDSRGNTFSPIQALFPANGKQSFASEGFSSTPKCQQRPQSGIELSRGAEAPAALPH